MSKLILENMKDKKQDDSWNNWENLDDDEVERNTSSEEREK